MFRTALRLLKLAVAPAVKFLARAALRQLYRRRRVILRTATRSTALSLRTAARRDPLAWRHSLRRAVKVARVARSAYVALT